MAAAVLPRRIVDALALQRASLAPRPYLVFENLPVDEHVFTTPDPQVYTPSCKSGGVSENLIMAFASQIGEPYSIFFEGSDIVNNLIPSPDTKRQYTGLGSAVELDFHIENAALKCMDDFDFSPLGLLLTGVRHDLQGPSTRIADARAALKLLTAEDIHCLRQPLFRIKVPYRWRRHHCLATQPVAIVCGNHDYPEISAVFYPDMIEAQTEEAASVLQRLHAATAQVAVAIDIKPGQLVYIDNRFALHSRDAFDASLDDSGNPMRWVQRVFVANSLWNHRNLDRVKARVFQPQEPDAC
ncbi:hypothetical protein CCOS865_00124 [Pseudomonas reidholzensis]|uniref:TauD/TfdA-like domain-containing protein n=1 Tax=Pseudomonas reidholzensis TaxID=1785162 RepID=A0A383RMC9_9PSED|nr:TauD/TfdA family dioxygenase [Pseudomonas reidholzensis]SYX87903.1 hypothetical protein CCOS865_00124 [Pseudomonas reidholzensis]